MTLEKIKKLCKIGIQTGEALLKNVIKKKNRKAFVKGKIAGYKNILSYINKTEEE